MNKSFSIVLTDQFKHEIRNGISRRRSSKNLASKLLFQLWLDSAVKFAFGAAITDQFKQDILNGVHQPGDTYKIALYTQAAATDKNKSATTYNTTGELATAGGYTQGGIALTGFTVSLSGDTAYIDWTTDPSWASASFTADAAVIYNSSRSNKILAVLSFGSTTATSGTFTVQLPAPGASATITIS